MFARPHRRASSIQIEAKRELTLQQLLLGLGGRFVMDAADFDGTNDYMLDSSAALADGKQGTFSCWFRADGGDATTRVFCANGAASGRFVINIGTASNTIAVAGVSLAGATILVLPTSVGYLAGGGWHHALASWDLANAASRWFYVDGVNVTAAGTHTNDTIDYDFSSNLSIGGRPDGSNKFNGCLAELFFHDAVLDLSVQSNREKFRTPDGYPANLGANGSAPFNAQPRVYLSLPRGSAASAFATNKGTSGDFTITGSLDVCTSSPSDNIFVVDSAQFDGTNDNERRVGQLNGAADSPFGILSVWLRMDGVAALGRILCGATALAGGTNRFRAAHSPGVGFQLVMETSGGQNILTSSNFGAGTAWIHILCAWDLTNSVHQLYRNDVSDLAGSTLLNGSVEILTNTLDWGIGGNCNGTNRINACMAELYFAPGQYLDLSVQANRRKFISATGLPVFLGADGSFPTGTAPIIYSHLNDAESAANFALNRGTGGDFTITGALTTGSTSPSGV